MSKKDTYKPVRTIEFRSSTSWGGSHRITIPHNAFVDLSHGELEITSDGGVLLAAYSNVTECRDISIPVERKVTNSCGCTEWKGVK